MTVAALLSGAFPVTVVNAAEILRPGDEGDVVTGPKHAEFWLTQGVRIKC